MRYPSTGTAAVEVSALQVSDTWVLPAVAVGAAGAVEAATGIEDTAEE